MNVLCKIFGHKPPVYAKSGWYSPGQEYGKLKVLNADNTGRVHGIILGDCARCNKEFMMARVHLPKDDKVKKK